MTRKIIYLMLFACLAVGLLSINHAFAEEYNTKQLNMRIASRSAAMDIFTCPEGSAQLIDAAGDPVGCEKWEGVGIEAKRVVELNMGSRFEVKPLYGTLVSSGAHTVLKYGYNLLYPKRIMEFVLYSGMGEILISNENHHDNSVIAMSKDGYFAVAGPRLDLEDLEVCYLTLYSPIGQEMFARRLGAGVYPTKISMGTMAVAVSITTGERDKEGWCDVVVYDNSGRLVNTAVDFTYVNTLLFVGDDEKYLLVFSINKLTLVNARDGQIIWQVPQFYRLVGPHSVDLSPDEEHLCILTAELTESRENIYIWRVNLVSIGEGSLSGWLDLSGRYPISRVKTVQWISNSSFQVKTGQSDDFQIELE